MALVYVIYFLKNKQKNKNEKKKTSNRITPNSLLWSDFMVYHRLSVSFFQRDLYVEEPLLLLWRLASVP